MDSYISLITGSWYYTVILILQGICIIHVLKNGREFYWIWIIMFIPVLGCGIYLYLNGSGALSIINPARYIKIPMLEVFNAKKIERDYKINDGLDNKIKYSDVLMSQGKLNEAHRLFESELNGPFKNNVNMLFAYAKILFTRDMFNEAIEILIKAENVQNNDRIKQRNLLLALSFEKINNIEMADNYFKLAQGGFVGEEAKVRYGLFLMGQKRYVDAKRCFEKVAESISISSWRYKREQRIWYNISKNNIKEVEKLA